MRFIDAHDFPVGLVLRVLDIASSTYYDWRARATLPARRRREDAELLGLIDEVRASHEFAGTYGSPRVWLELRRRGVRVGRKRVERIMRENDRRGAYLRKGWKGGPRSRTLGTSRPRTCWTGTSPRPRRTASGWPI
jgi:putative transposase